jgi:hypothetical protein
MGSKSIWKSKSFLTGIGTIIMAIALKYGIEITPTVMEGLLGLIASILVGKSVAKRIGQ